MPGVQHGWWCVVSSHIVETDPGVMGLESEIRLTGTRDLWEQAQLLVTLPREFTWVARHRRQLVMAELARRLVVT